MVGRGNPHPIHPIKSIARIYRIYRIIVLSHLFTQVVVVVFPHPLFWDFAKINKQKGMVTHYYLYFC